MSGPQPQPYKILHHRHGGDVLVGIARSGPPPTEEIVHLGGPFNEWRITIDAIAPNVDYFAICGFPASGLSRLQPPQDVVVLGETGPLAVYWYVSAEGASQGYSTIAWDHDHSLVWTVADPSDPNSKIVLRNIGAGPSQWFKLLRA